MIEMENYHLASTTVNNYMQEAWAKDKTSGQEPGEEGILAQPPRPAS